MIIHRDPQLSSDPRYFPITAVIQGWTSVEKQMLLYSPQLVISLFSVFWVTAAAINNWTREAFQYPHDYTSRKCRGHYEMKHLCNKDPKKIYRFDSEILCVLSYTFLLIDWT